MNMQVGKSAGIALLLAVALLALLFAFGLFTPQATPGVSAHECQSPGDDHEDNTGDNPCNTDANNDGTVDDLGDGDTAHAEGDHVIPTFSGSAYDSEEERYEFSIRENRDGSTTAITLGQVIATLPGGGDVDLDFTFTPNSGAGGAAEADFDDYPSGHVVYVGSGINFEAASTAETDPLAKDGDKKYIAGVFTVTARKEGAADADEGIADRTATAAIRVYVEDQDAGPPAAPMGVPVGQRDSVAAVNADDGPPAVAAVFPKGALSATAARKAMDVTWDRPDGVVDASTYTVRYRKVGESDDDWDTMTVGVDTNVDTDGGADTVNIAPAMVTLTGLDEKAKYEIQVRVAASDTDDNDNEWSATGMGETASVPAAVKIAVTSEGQDSGELMVSWTNDDAEGTMHDGGGDSKAMYKVEYGERRSFDPVQDNTLRSFETGGSSTTIGGLDNGTLYHVRVTAMNRVSMADNSEVVSGTPYGEPSSPRNLQVVAVSQTALLANWQAPANMGGYDTVDYDVTYQKVGDDSTSMTIEDVGATSASISGLEANTSYWVHVVATNERGESAPATYFGRTAVAMAPGVVQNLSVRAISQTQLSVSWNAPASDGGAAITVYSVGYRVQGATIWRSASRTGPNLGQSISGLDAGTWYEVRVAAMNSEGTGRYMQTTARTIDDPPPVEVSVPGLVRYLSVSPVSQTQLSVSWNAPASDGGAAITGYSVGYRVQGATIWRSASRTGPNLGQSISGLDAGTWYKVRVAAMNSEGTGSYEQATAQTLPAPVPPADPCLDTLSSDGPTNVQWTSGCESVERAGSHARFYTFTLTQESEVTVTLESDDADAYLYLRAGEAKSGGAVNDHVEDDDAGEGTNSQIKESLTAGTYTIEATTYYAGETGSFTLTLSGVGTTTQPGPLPADPCLDTLSSNGATTVQWTRGCESVERAGSHARFYTFTLTQESEVTITLESDDADAYLYLRAGEAKSGGAVNDHVEDDDAGKGTNSQIKESLTAGTYTIEATTYYAGETGSFTLTLSGVETTTQLGRRVSPDSVVEEHSLP